MASLNPKSPKNLYPKVDHSAPNSTSLYSPSSSVSISSLETEDLAENLFPDTQEQQRNAFESSEEVLIKIPGSVVHLIDKQHSVELASGVFEIIRLRQGSNVVAVLARVGDQIQWPLAKDEATVKLIGSPAHYFFTLRVPSETGTCGQSEDLLNYGLTITGKGTKELDRVLDDYSAFLVERTVGLEVESGGGSPEAKSAVYWTTLAPNVEDYGGSFARMIAGGSGKMIRGVLWCGDVTVERLKWGNEFLKKRMKSGSKSNVTPEALRRIRRVRRLTKMCESATTGLLSGIVKVSGFFRSSIVKSKPGKKFFKQLPGEIILASLDGFDKLFDAVEVAGRNVMSTTSTVMTDLVSHKHGEDAAMLTKEGMDAAGHAIGTAWALFRIHDATNFLYSETQNPPT